MLTDAQLVAFRRDGFVAVRRAVPTAVVERCVDVIWQRLAERGVRRNEPATWTEPLVRIDCPEDDGGGGPFAEAGTASALWEAYDQLLRPGTWWKRKGVGGTVPVRFPGEADPGEAGWHIDGSYSVNGTGRVNLRSRDRGLLALFLFTDVGPDDAPTRIRVGSHTDAIPFLADAGDDGIDFDLTVTDIAHASRDRPVAYATGAAGDVYLCHPFLVHAATWLHRGTTPRIIAQPGVLIIEPFPLTNRTDAHPVEATILDALSTLGRDAPKQNA
ncbi:phytanoyl-CoA dioxygenase family protein [Actinopolymorpha sp. B9G3]|uniref:phytanoyl-CoA dioxygenase family protein n=1 Tax=Actinopolymorpha sp. B9G3 TaxID=3158970 RepID=UPI0032D97F97